MSEFESQSIHASRISTASQVTTEELRAYLQSKGWFEDGKIRQIATIWHRREAEYAQEEVLLPYASAKDYRQRLRDALLTLASFEGREVVDTINDIKRACSNTVTVRVIHDDTVNGTIPISDGVLLITKAKDLLLAAVQSAYSKKKQFIGQVPKEARSYIDSLLLGQTEIGSYVVNVIAPVQEEGVEVVETSEVKIPLAQAVTFNLVRGIEALQKAAATYEDQGNLIVFDEAVLLGASSNMCDALLGFSGEKHNRTFEITVTVAPNPLFESPPKKFLFDTKHVELLEKATSYYKNDYVLPTRTLVGYIRKLSRAKDETSGVVTIEARVGGVDRNVQVELSGDDYHVAVLAHDTSKRVKIDGDVHVKGKRSRLLQSLNFSVIEIDDLF